MICGIANTLGKMKGVKIDLYLDTNIQPVAQPHTRILRKKVEADFKHLENLDIIEKVDGLTDWVSPKVVTQKQTQFKSVST